MGLTSKKKNDKSANKNAKNNTQASKFITKPGKTTGFVKKQGRPGAQRGS